MGLEMASIGFKFVGVKLHRILITANELILIIIMERGLAID